MRGVGPWIMGLLFRASSPTAPFLLSAACFFIAAAMASDRYGGAGNGMKIVGRVDTVLSGIKHICN